MVLAGNLAGVVSVALVALMLAGAGCQEQRAQAPARKTEPVRSVPARASSEEVRNSKPPTSSGESKPPTSSETPRGVTTNEPAPEAKRVPAEAGKPELTGPAVDLALKFVVGQAATYKITTERRKSIEWKGAPTAKPAQFADGRSGNRVELTFEQRVVRVLGDGNAVLEIMIKGLRYVGESVNRVVLDFDSARPEDAGNPLARLVGRSYQVKMSPKGQVVEIANAGPARLAVQGNLPGNGVAQKLLADEEIRNRHEIVALSALKDCSVRPGQTWSSIKVLSFDDLGAKTYERVYTLKQVDSGQLSVPSSQDAAVNQQLTTETSSGRLAVVEMKAIPSAALATQLYQRQAQAANPFAGMSDNADSYEGRLVLDLDQGQVREYGEQMQNEWIIFDPNSGPNPAAIRMAVRRLHRLEQVP
jgi:hypothetical protein